MSLSAEVYTEILVFSCRVFQSLALCTAAVLFMLSRDRLNMDVEKSVLELMLQLLNVDTNRNSPEKTLQGKTNVRI